MIRARRTLVALAALLSIVAAPAAVRAQGSSHAAPRVDRWIMGYYPMYAQDLLPIDEIDWPAMTHLVVGAVLPQADGSLDTRFDSYHAHPYVKQLTAAATAHHVVPVLMAGGAGAHDGFAAAATDHQAQLVTELLASMHHLGFKGLDLDWEPVTATDRPALASLVSAIRARAPHIVLTMPVGWVGRSSTVRSYWGRLSQQLDRINVMTYGMAGAWPGWKSWFTSALHGATAHGPTDVAHNVAAYRAAGVPAAKLGIGVGFYGTCWVGAITGALQKIGVIKLIDDRSMTYANIMANYYSGAAFHYDTATQSPYLSFLLPHGPQGCSFISYENPQSIAAKGAYAEREGLGSEIIWNINDGHLLGEGGRTGNPLLAAVHRSFH